MDASRSVDGEPLAGRIDRNSEFDALRRHAWPLPRASHGPHGSWRETRGRLALFSAPHEVPHVRDGVSKQAEPGTAGLAFALARSCGAAAICSADPQPGDPNWDEGHPYADRALALAAGGVIIDLHMMRPRGVDVCIGLGPFPDRTSAVGEVFMYEAVDAGLDLGVNWPFEAKRVALAAQLQRRGAVALQIELSYHCFDLSRPEMVAAWTALARATRQLMQRLASAA